MRCEPAAIETRLTDEERARLEAYEHLVADPDLVRGAALASIRAERLYRETHRTFEEYCRSRWQLSKTHVNRLIQAAEVLKNVTPVGVTCVSRDARLYIADVVAAGEAILR